MLGGATETAFLASTQVMGMLLVHRPRPRCKIHIRGLGEACLGCAELTPQTRMSLGWRNPLWGRGENRGKQLVGVKLETLKGDSAVCARASRLMLAGSPSSSRASLIVTK